MSIGRWYQRVAIVHIPCGIPGFYQNYPKKGRDKGISWPVRLQPQIQSCVQLLCAEAFKIYSPLALDFSPLLQILYAFFLVPWHCCINKHFLSQNTLLIDEQYCNGPAIYDYDHSTLQASHASWKKVTRCACLFGGQDLQVCFRGGTFGWVGSSQP